MKQYIITRIGYCLLSLFLLSLTIFFFVRVTGDPATLLVEPGERRGHRRHPSSVRSRPAALGEIRPVYVEPRPWRSRPVVLLPDAGLRALSPAPAELAAAGLRRDGS